MPQISIILSLLHRDLSRQKRAATLEALSDPPLEKWFPADEGKRGVIFSFISSERGSEPKQACFLAPLDSPLSAPAIPFGGRSRSVGAHAPTLSGNCNVLISTERVRPSVRPSFCVAAPTAAVASPAARAFASPPLSYNAVRHPPLTFYLSIVRSRSTRLCEASVSNAVEMSHDLNLQWKVGSSLSPSSPGQFNYNSAACTLCKFQKREEDECYL